MRVWESARSRRGIDNIMLLAVVACLAIALVRLAIVVAVIPYAVYVDARETARAEAAGQPAPDASIMDRIEHSPAGSWWSRTPPLRGGGDYLRAASRHSAIRTVGIYTGVLVERERAAGAKITRVLLPKDTQALYGAESGTLMTRPDGTTFRTKWASPKRDMRYFTDARVDEVEYQPLLTVAQSQQLAARTKLSEVSKSYLVGEPAENGSGTWILLARQTDRREFMLVPIESSPVGDGL